MTDPEPIAEHKLPCGCWVNFQSEECFPHPDCDTEHIVLGGEFPCITNTRRKSDELENR